jgi:hypothetical protein
MALTVRLALSPYTFNNPSFAAGEVCREWQTWGDHFHIQSIFGHSLLQATIYVVLAVCPYHISINPSQVCPDHLCGKRCRASCNIRPLVSLTTISRLLPLISVVKSAFHTGSSYFSFFAQGY